MNDNDKIVSAIYAASATWKDAPSLDAFLKHYESCLAALADRRATEKEAALNRSIETMRQPPR